MSEAQRLVHQLKRLGYEPDEKLFRQILALGAEAEPALLAVLTTIYQHPDADISSLHALRLLGDVGSVAMIEPLIRLFPLDVTLDDEQVIEALVAEVPQMIGRLGTAALAEVQRISHDESFSESQRCIAILVMPHIANREPDSEAEIISQLRARLQDETNRMLRTAVVRALCELHVRDAYPEIMAAYRAKQVMNELIAPSAARQMLLAERMTWGLRCVNHTLFERYQQHGPFAEDATDWSDADY